MGVQISGVTNGSGTPRGEASKSFLRNLSQINLVRLQEVPSFLGGMRTAVPCRLSGALHEE